MQLVIVCGSLSSLTMVFVPPSRIARHLGAKHFSSLSPCLSFHLRVLLRARFVFLRFGESFLVPSFSSANLQHCPWSFGPQAKLSGQHQPRARQAPLLSISNMSSFTFRALGSGYRLTTCSDSSRNQHPSSTFPLATTSSFIFSLASINSIIHSRDLAILDHFVMANARWDFSMAPVLNFCIRSTCANRHCTIRAAAFSANNMMLIAASRVQSRKFSSLLIPT